VAFKPNSIAVLIIAESMEDGTGIHNAHQGTMQWLCRRIEAGKQDLKYWGLSIIYLCYVHTMPTVTLVQNVYRQKCKLGALFSVVFVF
jgi:hypothetical protein